MKQILIGLLGLISITSQSYASEVLTSMFTIDSSSGKTKLFHEKDGWVYGRNCTDRYRVLRSIDDCVPLSEVRLLKSAELRQKFDRLIAENYNEINDVSYEDQIIIAKSVTVDLADSRIKLQDLIEYGEMNDYTIAYKQRLERQIHHLTIIETSIKKFFKEKSTLEYTNKSFNKLENFTLFDFSSAMNTVLQKTNIHRGNAYNCRYSVGQYTGDVIGRGVRVFPLFHPSYKTIGLYINSDVDEVLLKECGAVQDGNYAIIKAESKSLSKF